MTETGTPVDAKAGASTMCRRGEHARCKTAQARCTCTCHGAAGQTPPPQHSRRPPMPPRSSSLAAVPNGPTAPRTATSTPVAALHRCEPPVSKRGRVGLAESISALVPDLAAEAGVWFQVAAWPGKSSAQGMAKRMRDAHPTIEWRAAVLAAGSGLWAKAPA